MAYILHEIGKRKTRKRIHLWKTQHKAYMLKNTLMQMLNEVYDAWINPEKLKQWWKPAGNKLVNVENEVREGGNINYEFAGDNDEKLL